MFDARSSFSFGSAAAVCCLTDILRLHRLVLYRFDSFGERSRSGIMCFLSFILSFTSFSSSCSSSYSASSLDDRKHRWLVNQNGALTHSPRDCKRNVIIFHFVFFSPFRTTLRTNRIDFVALMPQKMTSRCRKWMEWRCSRLWIWHDCGINVCACVSVHSRKTTNTKKTKTKVNMLLLLVDTFGSDFFSFVFTSSHTAKHSATAAATKNLRKFVEFAGGGNTNRRRTMRARNEREYCALHTSIACEMRANISIANAFRLDLCGLLTVEL